MIEVTNATGGQLAVARASQEACSDQITKRDLLATVDEPTYLCRSEVHLARPCHPLERPNEPPRAIVIELVGRIPSRVVQDSLYDAQDAVGRVLTSPTLLKIVGVPD